MSTAPGGCESRKCGSRPEPRVGVGWVNSTGPEGYSATLLGISDDVDPIAYLCSGGQTERRPDPGSEAGMVRPRSRFGGVVMREHWARGEVPSPSPRDRNQGG